MNKKWIEVDIDMWDLLFYFFYEEERIATIYKDGDGDWCCDSKILKMNEDFIDYGYVSCQEVKDYIEDRIRQHYVDEVDYHKEVLRIFEEE